MFVNTDMVGMPLYQFSTNTDIGGMQQLESNGEGGFQLITSSQSGGGGGGGGGGLQIMTDGSGGEMLYDC